MRLLRRMRFVHRARKARRDERDEIETLLRLVRPGDFAVDVGSYKGSHLYWMRRAVGTEGRVLAFEPQPALAAYLRAAAAACGWSNVEVRAEGVSARSGTRELAVPRIPGRRHADGVAPGASFEALAEGGPARRMTVATVTLDEALLDRADAPAFVKIDVEGHELEVLRGAARLLASARPVLLVECEERHGGAPHELARVVAGHGYRADFFGPGGLRPLAEFRPEVHQARSGPRYWDAPGYCNNFLFRPG